MGEDKIVSVRIPNSVIKQLRKNGTPDKLSTKINKLINECIELEYTKEHNWMMIPRPLGKYLFSLLTDDQVKTYCDKLMIELIKVQHSQFPDKSLWETWLQIDWDWNKKIGSTINYKKTENVHHYYVEHGIQESVSKIIYEMFLRTSNGNPVVTKKILDNEKLSLIIEEV